MFSYFLVVWLMVGIVSALYFFISLKAKPFNSVTSFLACLVFSVFLIAIAPLSFWLCAMDFYDTVRENGSADSEDWDTGVE